MTGSDRWSLPRALVWFGVLAAVLLGFALRMGLRPNMWWINPDEGYYYQVATTASPEVAERVIRKNAHPPLHYRILRWTAPLVSDVAELRYLSLLAGLLTIAASGWLGSLCGGLAGGSWGRMAGAWLGALSVAVAPGISVQSMTLRPYSLCLLALTAGIGALLRFAETGRLAWLSLLSLSFTFAVLELYSSFLVVLAVGVVILAEQVAGRLSRRQIFGLLGAAAPVAVAMGWLYLAYLRPYVLGKEMHRWATTVGIPQAYAQNLLQAFQLLTDAAEYVYTTPLAWLLVLAGALGVGLAVARRRGLPGLLLLALVAIAMTANFLRLMPLGGSRHSLYLFPPFMAAASYGLGWLVGNLASPGANQRSRWGRGARSLLLVGTAAVFLSPMAHLAYRSLHDGPAAVLGPTRAELVVPRQTVGLVADFVRQAPAGIWLTDRQTAQLLMPLARPQDEELVPEPAFSGFHLDVLGRRFAVVKEWEIARAFATRDFPLDRLLAWTAASAPSAGDDGIGLVAGGWGVSEAYRLARHLQASGAPDFPAAGDRSLAAVIVAPAVLRSWQEHRADTARAR